MFDKAFHHHDNKQLLNFLENAASSIAFSHQNLASFFYKHNEATNVDSPLLDPLFAEDPLLSLLLARYDDVGLASLLWNYTLRPSMAALLSSLSSLGKELTERVKMVFNRQFTIYEHGHVKYLTLHSKLILDFSSVLFELTKDLQNYWEKSFVFSKHRVLDLKEDPRDNLLLQELGFKQVDDNFFSDASYLLHYEKFLSSATLLSKTFSQLIRQTLWNGQNTSQLSEVLANLDKIFQNLNQIRYVHTQNIPLSFQHAENLRRSFSIQLYALDYNVKICLEHMAILVDPKLFSQTPSNTFNLSIRTKNSLFYTLLLSGQGLSSSRKAVEDLDQYCQKNRLLPQDILPSEFGKIHPLLLDANTYFLSEMAERKSSLDEQKTKKDLYHTAQSLKEKFENLLKIFVPIVMLSSCGLKTNPKSSTPDLRPEIPFIESVVAEPQEASHADATPSTSQNKK